MTHTAAHQQADARPLDSFPAIRSCDIEEVGEAVRTRYGARGFSLLGDKEDFRVRANHWQSRKISLSYCSYGAEVQVDFPAAGFFRQQFCVRGATQIKVGRTAHEVTSKELCVVPAGSDLQINFRPGFEQIVLRVDEDALLQKIEALTGSPPGRALVFEPRTSADKPAMEVLRRRLSFCASELDSEDLRESPVAIAELEQLLIVSFLRANASNYSAGLEVGARRPASWQIRLAEEYIEAHWDEPLTIEALSRATGVSARSIFHYFKVERGKTPMDFLKQVRLRHAREMLDQGDGAVTVTEVAFACGFGNLSHFAKDYFQRFGEKPSQTVRRAKSARQWLS